MMPVYYAHSRPGRPEEEWRRLEDHLKNVAEMARGFAGPLKWRSGTVTIGGSLE